MRKNGDGVQKSRKIIVSFFFILLIITEASSQPLKKIKDHCGLYFSSLSQLNTQLSSQIKFYAFQPRQTVASIGAQCANWEAAFAATTDSITFFLEDIDSTYLNQKQASFAWDYYSRLKGMPLSSQFKIVLGDEKSTHLPDHFFDKILVMDSFHEFTHQQEMLADLSQKLKPGGIVYIDETLARKTGDIHPGCKKRIYTESELIEIFRENGFVYQDGLAMNFRKTKPVRKIFAFRKR